MNNQTVLITGASGGIGLELAREFAAHGHNLILVARSEGKLETIAADLRREHQIETAVMPYDLTDPNAPEQLFAETEAAGFKVDYLVNNAGFASYGEFAALPKERELNMIQLNVMALTHLTRLYLPSMIERNQGGVLNVASTAAFQPGPLMAVYYATKAFVLSFTEAIAEEVVDSNLHIQALCPGPTASGFQERAEMQDSKLVQNGLMSSTEVAQQAYAGLMAGDVVVIPGLRNKMMANLVRFLPRSTVRRTVKQTQARVES